MGLEIKSGPIKVGGVCVSMGVDRGWALVGSLRSVKFGVGT